MLSEEIIAKCPVCDSTLLQRCAEIDDIPVFCNVLLANRSDAISAQKGDLRLDVCSVCGHAHNSAFNSELVQYTEDYDCSLHYSSSFQTFASQLAEDLVDRYRLNDKTVVEIGCGKGDFISLLCTLGNNRGIGFDPSFDGLEGRSENTANLEIIKDYYSEKYGDLEVNFICCRHAIEHIENPVAFLKTIRQAVGDKTDTALYFEVPDVLYTLKELGIWDLIYEHCGYFCESSCQKAFTESGFTVTQLETAFGGQYLALHVEPNKSLALGIPNINSSPSLNRYFEYVDTFSQRYRSKLAEWRKKLNEFKQDNLKVVVWGCGSKGVTFLNILNVDEEVSYIVDINPHKNGKFTAGTGHQVVSPEFLKGYKPNVVIVMNPLYKSEIKDVLSELEIQSQVITA